MMMRWGEEEEERRSEKKVMEGNKTTRKGVCTYIVLNDFN